MLFQNEDESLRIEVASYESPHGREADADWLVLKGVYTADGESAVDRNACLSTAELRGLTAGLKVLAAGLRDSYVSDFLEEDFTLSVLRSGEDRFRAHVTFAMLDAPVDWDAAEVDVACDTACLKDWIAELEEAEKRFPERS